MSNYHAMIRWSEDDHYRECGVFEAPSKEVVIKNIIRFAASWGLDVKPENIKIEEVNE